MIFFNLLIILLLCVLLIVVTQQTSYTKEFFTTAKTSSFREIKNQPIDGGSVITLQDSNNPLIKIDYIHFDITKIPIPRSMIKVYSTNNNLITNFSKWDNRIEIDFTFPRFFVFATVDPVNKIFMDNNGKLKLYLNNISFSPSDIFYWPEISGKNISIKMKIYFQTQKEFDEFTKNLKDNNRITSKIIS